MHYLSHNNYYQNVLTMVLLHKNYHTDFYAAMTPMGLPLVRDLKCLNRYPLPELEPQKT